MENIAIMKRSNFIDLLNKKVLISKISGSLQENDLSEPPNCSGFGRIRHFKRNIECWNNDPLPIDPALKALGKDESDVILAQVFQVGYCNMNCWYCFVPDDLKSGKNCEWFSANELLDMFLEEKNECFVIDISGGNPELVPEFILWFMKALIKKKKMEDYYLNPYNKSHNSL
jgi:uncharacterized radical SAM superfamily Fe-S cluster-containing enzyme